MEFVPVAQHYGWIPVSCGPVFTPPCAPPPEYPLYQPFHHFPYQSAPYRPSNPLPPPVRDDPDARLFVGDLPYKVDAGLLCEQLKAMFSPFGDCHVHIKYGEQKQRKHRLLSHAQAEEASRIPRLPTGWVQFNEIGHADAALKQHRTSPFKFLNRSVRVEKARGKRTAKLYYDPLSVSFPFNREYIMSEIRELEAFQGWHLAAEPKFDNLQNYVFGSWMIPICGLMFRSSSHAQHAVEWFYQHPFLWLQIEDVDVVSGPYPSSVSNSSRSQNSEPGVFVVDGNGEASVVPHHSSMNTKEGAVKGESSLEKSATKVSAIKGHTAEESACEESTTKTSASENCKVGESSQADERVTEMSPALARIALKMASETEEHPKPEWLKVPTLVKERRSSSVAGCT